MVLGWSLAARSASSACSGGVTSPGVYGSGAVLHEHVIYRGHDNSRRWGGPYWSGEGSAHARSTSCGCGRCWDRRCSESPGEASWEEPPLFCVKPGSRSVWRSPRTRSPELQRTPIGCLAASSQGIISRAVRCAPARVWLRTKLRPSVRHRKVYLWPLSSHPPRPPPVTTAEALPTLRYELPNS